MSAQTPLQTFIDLSAVLTGFPSDQLGAPLDPDALAATYYAKVDAEATAGLANVLSAFTQVQADSGGDPARELELFRTRIWNDANHGSLARQIVGLWYLGRWNGGPYLSDATYIRALAWQAMETKAIGYSEFTDQYWARPPASAPTTRE
jgi:hypothetical protein